MNSVKKYYFGNRRIIFLLVIAYLGFPNQIFCADYNPFADSVKKLQSRAEAGESEAQFTLGKLYYYGFGIERNFAEAIKPRFPFLESINIL